MFTRTPLRADKADIAGHTTPEEVIGEPTPRKRPGRPTGDVQAEMLAALQQIAATSSDAAALLRGGIRNSVLEVSERQFDTNGLIVFNYHAEVGSVVVSNPATTSVTFQAGPASGGSAPTIGNGIQVVPASSWLAIPVGHHSFTLYGTSAALVGVQVFAGMQAFGVAR